MKSFIHLFSPLAAVLLFATVSPTTALWPQPRTLHSDSNDIVRLSDSFDVTVDRTVDLSSVPNLAAAINRTKDLLRGDKLERLVPGRGQSDKDGIAQAQSLDFLVLFITDGAEVHDISAEAQRPLRDRNEAYNLFVPTNGTAILNATSTLGLFRGLTTFTQLWYSFNETTYAPFVPITIQDSPAFPYRGFMLDTARNFFPLDDIKRTLDAMSWVKLNQLHWHIVDSHSFPLELPDEFEKLWQMGAYSPSSVYTHNDVNEIIAYAGARGIDVMVEIDTPGHSYAISKAFPEHVACAGKTPYEHYASAPPAGQLRIASDATTNFTGNLLAAVAKMFPSTLMSPGGDEVHEECYNEDSETQDQLNGRTLEQAFNQFVNVTHQAIVDLGKTPVVWQELAQNDNITTLNPNTIVLAWKTSDESSYYANNVKGAIRKGFQVIHAASDHFYLDCGAGPWLGNFPNGQSWCQFSSWQKAYVFDPFAGLLDNEKDYILGGQHVLWSEQSGPSNLDSIAWPRAAASAEIFWTGIHGNSSDALQDALPRLHDLSFRLRRRNVRSTPLQPFWCILNPGSCDLGS